MYDEKMKAKHEAIKKIIEEMDNLMMGKMMPKEEEEEETPMEVKVMKLEAKPEEEQSFLMSIFVSWFPMILLIGVWVFFMRQMQGGGKGGGPFSLGK